MQSSLKNCKDVSVIHREAIDIAGKFYSKNSEQIAKRLESPKQINDPGYYLYIRIVPIKEGTENRRSGVNYAIVHAKLRLHWKRL